MIRILPFLHLVFTVWVVYQIWQAPIRQETKIMWSGVVIFFPVVGILAWLFYGHTKY